MRSIVLINRYNNEGFQETQTHEQSYPPHPLVFNSRVEELSSDVFIINFDCRFRTHTWTIIGYVD